MNCNNCGSLTSNPKYCTRRCAAISNNKKFPKRTLEGTCLTCKLPVRSKRKYCSSCRPTFMTANVTIGVYRNALSVKGKHPSWLNSHIRGLNRTFNADLTKLPCHNCGYSKHVELAHIRGVATFPDETLVSEVNAKSNVIQLCRNCHWELDNGILILAPPSGNAPDLEI